MNERTLCSLAMLQVQTETNQDYIEYFVPFVAECLRVSPHDEVSNQELQQIVQDKFGILIPRAALDTILARCKNHKFVSKEHGIYKRDQIALGESDFPKIQSDMMRRQTELLQKLSEFSALYYNKQLNTEDAEVLLLAYLDEHSASVLAASVEGCTIPQPQGIRQKDHFLANAFVQHLYEADSNGFSHLELIVKGRMLADVLTLPDLNSVKRPFNLVSFYFDTPFLIGLLGFHGSSLKSLRQELIHLLKEENTVLCVFEHTLIETIYALTKTANAMRRSDRLYGRQSREVLLSVDAGFRSSELELAIEKLPNTLENMGFVVKKAPANNDNELYVKLRKDLQSIMQYRRDEALELDVKSLTAIDSLRDGEVCTQLERCPAVFVTANDRLAGASLRSFGNKFNRTSVPHCLLDQYVSTIVWLKSNIAVTKLPRKQIIANCFAALNPSDVLWRKYLLAIERARNNGDLEDDDYYVLRGSGRLLMDLTLGEESSFTEGTWEEVLQVANINALKKAEQMVKIVHAQRENQLLNDQKVTEQELAHMRQRHLETEGRLAEYATTQGNKQEFYRSRSVTLARQAANILIFLIIISLLIATTATFFDPAKFLQVRGVKYLFLLASLIATVIGLLHLVQGTSVKGLGKWLNEKFFNIFMNFFIRLKDL